MASNSSSATYFPLRWESTGDKWWYASPIDCAAANGHYELVRELLRMDANHLISLTSLRRLRRLESVWDDAGDAHFAGAAKSRSAVARQLLHDCEFPTAAGEKNNPTSKTNPLIRAGYGGWLLYTAASAGDVGFVKELLGRDPLLVFGEGEYGLTEMLYAAARSKNAEVFWVLYDFAASPRFEGAAAGEKNQGAGKVPSGFKWEVVNRAVHAAARGGNVAVLAELLGGAGDGVLAYRDSCGSTVLHAAASKGQIEVVKYLIATYDGIASSTDEEGNTPLHVAAYKGQVSVVETLLRSSPSLLSSTNKAGNTLLHMAVAGALSPGFRRVDRQLDLIKHLTTTETRYAIDDIINAKNDEGRTALHMAVIGNVHSDLVQRLTSARFVNVNVRDRHGLTPLDYLRRQPRSSSSQTLMRRLISAGGMSNCQDYNARKAIASVVRMQGSTCSSPGTSFRVLDSEIFKHSGVGPALTGSRIGHRGVKIRHVSTPSQVSQCDSNGGEEEHVKKHGGAVEKAAKRLKTMFHWPKARKFDEAPVPLRERFASPSNGNKRRLGMRSEVSSPSNRKRFASDVVQGVMLEFPYGNGHARSSSYSVTKTSMSSQSSMDGGKGADDAGGCPFGVQGEADETPRMMQKQGSVKRKQVMNQYLCFGGSGLSVKNPIGRHSRNTSNGSKQAVACH